MKLCLPISLLLSQHRWHPEQRLNSPPLASCPLRPAPPLPPAGLSRADADSPSNFAEALLGREFNSKSLQQFLQHGGEVLRFYLQGQGSEGERCAGVTAGLRAMRFNAD